VYMQCDKKQYKATHSMTWLFRRQEDRKSDRTVDYIGTTGKKTWKEISVYGLDGSDNCCVYIETLIFNMCTCHKCAGYHMHFSEVGSASNEQYTSLEKDM
jgi:hypothetical protein